MELSGGRAAGSENSHWNGLCEHTGSGGLQRASAAEVVAVDCEGDGLREQGRAMLEGSPEQVPEVAARRIAKAEPVDGAQQDQELARG